MGVTASESLEQMAKRVPVPETNFFAIVIAVQQKAGGNLSEALGNLVARAARTQEDAAEGQGHVERGEGVRWNHRLAADHRRRAPLCVEPALCRIALDHQLQAALVMAVSGFWMFLGIMSMKKMIAFDM